MTSVFLLWLTTETGPASEAGSSPLLIPMSPALGALPVPTRRSVVLLLLALSTGLQLLWLWCTCGPVKTCLTVP